MKKTILLLFAAFNISMYAQTLGVQTLGQLNESPAGSKLIQLLDLINNGEEISDNAITQLFSKRLTEKISTDELKSILEDIRQQDGQLDLFEANRSEKFKYETTFRSKKNGDWMGGFILIEHMPPYGIDGFGLDNGEQPKGVKEPIYGPGKIIEFKEEPIVTAALSEVAINADKIAQDYHDVGWFSGVVLMAENDKPYFQKAFGKADIENNADNTTATKFRIGSINKDYTAVLVLQQVQDGLISLEDKLSKFNLGFPNKIADKITVRNLLNHTAGFPDIFIPEYLENIRDYKNIDDIMPLLMNEPLVFEPGEDQQYSNYGYVVLGAILEKVTGKKFGQLLDDKIHAITGCKNTDYNIAENISGEAQSYRYSVTGNKINHTPNLEYPTPDGGMYATADDLLNFFSMLFYTEKLLKDEYKVLLVNDFNKSDLSWKELLNNPRAEAGFAGGGPGVSAVMEINFHKNHFVIVLANTDRGVAEEVAHSIVNAYKGGKVKKAQIPPANYLFQIYKKEGKGYLVNNFKKILKEGGYNDKHSILLNSAGYALMQEDKLDEAIDIFSANTTLFPDEANPFDSLAEAYLKKGDKINAKKYYEKALAIDPTFPSAKSALKKL